MINDELALWGLTDENTIDEIWDTTFKYLEQQGGRLAISTLQNGVPQSRIISVQRMEADGGIYLMTSRGKPFYKQMKENPNIAAATLIDDTHHSFRLKAVVEESTDPAIYAEYARKNPGTMKMYRHNTDLIALFKLKTGTGEILHLYRDDMVRRLRFGWGGGVPEPLTYYMTDACTGCGICYDVCAEHSIVKTEDGKYQIRSMDCDDCGICYTKCPLKGTAMKSRIIDG